MERFGAGLQLAGLVIVGLGLLRGVADASRGAVWAELGIAAAGAAVFLVGWLMAGRGGSSWRS